MKVVILNAYSAANSGDGLLVKLAVDAVRRNFGDATQITVVAADTSTFHGFEGAEFVDAPVMSAHGLARLTDAALLPRAYAAFDRYISAADLLVGVGGGYMRSKNATEHIKLVLGHQQQLHRAIASGVPLVCLPQSIGPFYAGRSRFVAAYASAASVFVRDNRSYDLLGGSVRDNIVRSPDLAVQEVASRIGEHGLQLSADRRIPESICLVLRKPPAWSARRQQRYNARMRELAQRLASQCRVTYALQSTTRGNDDLAYYQEQGIGGDYIALKQCLAGGRRPDLVISVRLHGALESVLAGVPAYHISYERKGFGAYEDLGADDWVCNGGDFDVDSVIQRIFADHATADFAQKLQRGVASIRQATQSMDILLKRYAK